MSGRDAAVERRAALKTLAGVAGLGVAAHLASACRPEAAGPAGPPPVSAGAPGPARAPGGLPSPPGPPAGEPVRVPLSDLSADGRAVVDYGDARVEVRRTEAGVEARLLLCTHFGCPVAWDAARERYACPCHGALFDAEGVPVAGPPTTPLRRVPVALSADAVTVGAPSAGSS